jgi:hypothetical protein
MKDEVKDRRAEEVEEINSPKGTVPPDDADFQAGLIEDVRRAADADVSDAARDDRVQRGARANQERPNEDH